MNRASLIMWAIVLTGGILAATLDPDAIRIPRAGDGELPQQCARGSIVAAVTHVRDGDTIEVGGLPIRLQGLAAPEGNEPGGVRATQAMRAMVQGRELRCELDGERTHDRCVGICYLEGQDISEVMVRQGLARDCPKFSRGRYAEAERHAAADGATIGRVYPLPGYCRSRR